MPLRRRSRLPRRMRTKNRKLRYRRKGRISKTLNAMKDRARVVEVENFGALNANVGQNLTWALAQFPRALAVSQNYRYYRCTKVELDFIPYANVFAPGQSLPELYYQTDYTTTVSQNAPTQASMEGRGVVPLKWTGVIKRRITPATLRFENLEVQGYVTHGPDNIVNMVQPVTSTPVKYKWYMTQKTANPQQFSNVPPGTITQVGPAIDPTNLKYYGAAFLPNCPIIPPTAAMGRLVIKTHWEFKEPLVVAPSDGAVTITEVK